MKKREPFRHIRDGDRDRIQALRDEWHSQKSIAAILGVSKSAISRELSRNPTRTGRYVADRARAHAENRRSNSKYPGMKIEAHPELKRYVISQLTRLRSPDEIAGHLKRNGVIPRVGTNAIYRWLYHEEGQPFCRYLCTRRTQNTRQKREPKRALIPNRIPLSERPDASGLIHAERDLFVSPTRSHVRSAGLLIVVPGVKFLAGSILPNRESATVMASAKRHFRRIRVDTCIADNGIENVAHAMTGIPTYFCDRGAPWQKPNVEGGIGLIRRWFLPKGTDLSRIPDEVFQSQLHLLNSKYRKSLGYRSAYEVAVERGIIAGIPRISLTPAVAFR